LRLAARAFKSVGAIRRRGAAEGLMMKTSSARKSAASRHALRGASLLCLVVALAPAKAEEAGPNLAPAKAEETASSKAPAKAEGAKAESATSSGKAEGQKSESASKPEPVKTESAKAEGAASTPEPEGRDWRGMYVGGAMGGSLPLDRSETLQAVSGLVGPLYGLHPPSQERGGIVFGGLAGYNFQAGHVVLGAETELNLLEGRRGPSGTFFAPPAYAGLGVVTYTLARPNSDGNYFASFRGRVGYAIDNALLYATFGVASGGWRSASGLFLNNFAPGNLFSSGETASSRMKFVAGGGLEWGLDAHWSARAEYLFLDQSYGTQLFDNGAYFDFLSKTRTQSHVFRLGLLYNLGADNLLPKPEGKKEGKKEAKEGEKEGKKEGDKQAEKDGKKEEAKTDEKPQEGARTAWPNVARPTEGNVTSTATESAKINPTTPQDVPDEERYSFHAQSTVVAQGYPKLYALYSGQNSLPPDGQVRATNSTTGFFGLRLWDGGEAYVNPEIDEGYGLGDTLGLAGFSSAEAYKVGHARPYLRFQRYFARQTIGLGGESETIDPGQNLLGGSVEANRLTFTIGKYSVVDIFDDNRYAHDTRNGFLNWSVIDMGAFDYAADSWGYTEGATLEWKQDWWTARTGAFQLSITPNSEWIEPVLLRQYEVVGEIEARHQLLFDQPGKVKLLAYALTGFMGKYEDAVLNGFLTDTTPDVTQNRIKRTKVGGGINIEQPYSDTLGFFLRASMLNGRYETYEFTDIQRSLSGGFVLTGASWDRPKDAIGVAGVVNGLSGNQVQYFAAGGLGVLIGDGALNYNGEHILETYYRYSLGEGVHLTGDYQFVHNPAYNKDRGPANIFALRLHGEF
jgi:high affinity Mn2+ porin